MPLENPVLQLTRQTSRDVTGSGCRLLMWRSFFRPNRHLYFTCSPSVPPVGGTGLLRAETAKGLTSRRGVVVSFTSQVLSSDKTKISAPKSEFLELISWWNISNFDLIIWQRNWRYVKLREVWRSLRWLFLGWRSLFRKRGCASLRSRPEYS